MKCDLCDKEAVVHEVMMRDGQQLHVHLCGEHAAAKGYGGPTGMMPEHIAEQLQKRAKKKRPRKAIACDLCGMTLANYRSGGLLGCPECYRVFERQLEPIIGRAQAGATHHCGHAPPQAVQHVDRKLHRSKLLRELNEAVAAEQYERAARLRDQLQELESSLGSEKE
jgi:protein arginine kinase activator